MRFKYYLRGIGLGIIFTTIVLTISNNINGNRLSKDEIVQEALKLGMIMPETESQMETQVETQIGTELDSTQTEDTDTQSQDTTENVSNTEQQNDEANQQDSSQLSDGETNQPNNSEIQNDSQQTVTPPQNSEGGENVNPNEQTTENPTNPQDTQSQIEEPQVTYVEYYVRVGATAHEVAMGLERAGAIEDGLDFRAYLSRKGYTHKLRVGNYQIPVNGDYEEIARILMKRR